MCIKFKLAAQSNQIGAGAMSKRFVEKETLTISREREVSVLDGADNTKSRLDLVKALLGDLWSWAIVNRFNLKKDDTDGESNS